MIISNICGEFILRGISSYNEIDYSINGIDNNHLITETSFNK